MASAKVKQLIDIFRNHFKENEAGEIPIALRQEPVDIVYTSLLEDDAPAQAPLTPMLGGLGDMGMGAQGGLGAMDGGLGGMGMGLAGPAVSGAGDIGLPATDSVDDFLMGM